METTVKIHYMAILINSPHEWEISIHGSFPKSGDPNIDPKIL